MSEMPPSAFADQRGQWCNHGKLLMVPDPADQREYPDYVVADPWPCADGCTPEKLAADMAAEAAAYEQERWDEYYDSIREFRNHADDLGTDR
jgi:hypothetical protein